MQEEVENRTLTLIVSGTKFTGRLFKAAVSKYMAHRKEKKLEKQRSRDSPVTPKGKQTVKQLIGQNQGVSNIEINDPSIRDFERIARKYGVDYAVKKDRSASPPKYLIFFKARDADALTAAFSEYTQKKVKKADRSERPSCWRSSATSRNLLKMRLWTGQSGRSWNDEAAEYEKAGAAEPARFCWTNFPTILNRLTGMFSEDRADFIASFDEYDLPLTLGCGAQYRVCDGADVFRH